MLPCGWLAQSAAGQADDKARWRSGWTDKRKWVTLCSYDPLLRLVLVKTPVFKIFLLLRFRYRLSLSVSILVFFLLTS